MRLKEVCCGLIEPLRNGLEMTINFYIRLQVKYALWGSEQNRFLSLSDGNSANLIVTYAKKTECGDNENIKN